MESKAGLLPKHHNSIHVSFLRSPPSHCFPRNSADSKTRQDDYWPNVRVNPITLQLLNLPLFTIFQYPHEFDTVLAILMPRYN